MWAETMTEAYFLQKTVFSSKENSGNDEDAYMLTMISRVSAAIDKRTKELT
jgi:hypothetical protein